MGKYEQLVADHLYSRKAKNKVASDVLGTLRGEVETALKNPKNTGKEDSLTETLAKAMTKALRLVGTEQAQKEMDILEGYLPVELSDEDILSEISSLNLVSLPNIGARMNASMTLLKGRADGADVMRVIKTYYK